MSAIATKAASSTLLNEFGSAGQPDRRMVNRRQSDLEPLDSVRPAMARADLSPLGLSVRDGLIRACGSLKAAAITMQMDQGQLTRDLQTGAFKIERLTRLSPTERAIVIDTLHQDTTPLSTPKARLREIHRQRKQLDDEADQIIEGLV